MHRFILIVSLLLAAACAPREIAPVQYWRLESINGLPFAGYATLGLGRSRYLGRAPCNSYSGTLEREPFPALILSPPEATEAACPELALEQVYLANLARVVRSRVSPGALTLVTQGGTELRFRQASGAP